MPDHGQPRSWKTEVSVFGEDCDAHGWHDNALRFATKEEAVGYGSELFGRWTLAKETRAVESNDPVNYRFNFERYKAEPLPPEVA